MVSFPDVDVDVALDDSSGRRLCHIRRHGCVRYSRRSDGVDCVALSHVLRQNLYHSWHRNETWVWWVLVAFAAAVVAAVAVAAAAVVEDGLRDYHFVNVELPVVAADDVPAMALWQLNFADES